MAFQSGFLAICQVIFALSCNSFNDRLIYVKSHLEDKIQQPNFLIFRNGLDTSYQVPQFFPYVTGVVGPSGVVGTSGVVGP
jgi:hypothetical protein